MFSQRRVRVLVVSLLSSMPLVACGRTDGVAAQRVAQGAVTPSVADGPVTTPIPVHRQINWEHLLDSDVAIASPPSDPGDAASTAVRQGQLTFTPVVPTFNTPFKLAVSDPTAVTVSTDRGVEFLFDFGQTSDFPSDGRVAVLEMPSGVTDDVLRRIVAEHAGTGNFRMISLAGGSGMLVAANGIGRVVFVRGGIRYDVTGPAVSPAKAQELAGMLASQVTG